MRQEAYEALRGLIVAGTLAPDEALRDGEIARWLGVSRMPVREALVRLDDEGLVVIAPNRFTRVAPMDPGAASEAHRLVGLLQGELAARRAAEAVGNNGLPELAETFNWALWRGDPAEALAADDAFHAAALRPPRAADAASLAATLVGRLLPLARRAQRAVWPAVARGWPAHAHEALIAALEARDVVAAREAAVGEWLSLADVVAKELGG